MIYDWEEGYAGGDPIRWISDNPVIFVNTGENFNIPALIGKIIEEKRDFRQAGELLGLINVKFLLYRKDIVWNYITGHHGWFAHNPEKIERFLKNQKDLKLVKVFGPWEVYEVAAENIFPRIYIPEKNILAIGGSDIMEYFSSGLVSEEKDAIFFLEGKIDPDKVKKISPSQVIIEEKPELLLETEYNNNLRDLSLKEVNDLLVAVRYYPGSILHNAVRIKEPLQQFLAPFPQKIQYELLFMEKRLKESHFSIVKGKIAKASKSLGEIISSWEKVENDSNKVIIKKDKDELLLMIDKELSLQKIFINALKREIPEKIEDQKIKKAIDDLSDVVDQKRIYFFGVKLISADSAKDEQEVIYNLNIPVLAVYDLYLPIEAFESWPIKEGDNIQFKIDNEKIVNKSLEKDGEWKQLFSLGEFPLAEGKHLIKLLLPSGNNLIADPSFENDTWEGIPEYIHYFYFKERPFKEQSREATEGKYSLKLFSSLNNVAVFNRIIDFNPKYIYRVFVSTKNLSNGPQELVFWENETDNSIPVLDPFLATYTDPFGSSEQPTQIQTMVFPNYSQWQRYQFIFSPKNSSAKSGGLAFVSGRTLFGETANLYDDVRVERVFDSPILLRTVISHSNSSEPEPKIEFKKINSTKNMISVKGVTQPYFLIFSEAFHKGWDLSINGEHLKMNDFANGWYIDKLGDYKITLFFKPQKVYFISIFVSISSFVILVLYFIRRKLGR